MNLSKKQKLVLIGFSILFVIMVAVGIYFAAVQSQMGRVMTDVTPADSTLKLDGKEIPISGQTYVTPGKHELTASRDAFTSKTTTFEIAKGEAKSFNMYLLPDGSAGEQWLKDHPEQAYKIDGLIGKEYTELGEKVTAANKILQDLPIIDGTFRIDQGASKTGKDFALYIQAADQTGRDNALATLKLYGYEPSFYEIIYVTPDQLDATD